MRTYTNAASFLNYKIINNGAHFLFFLHCIRFLTLNNQSLIALARCYYRSIPGKPVVLVCRRQLERNQNDTTVSLQKPHLELRTKSYISMTKTGNTYTSHCTFSNPQKRIFYFRKIVLKLRYLTALLRGMLMIHG